MHKFAIHRMSNLIYERSRRNHDEKRALSYHLLLCFVICIFRELLKSRLIKERRINHVYVSVNESGLEEDRTESMPVNVMHASLEYFDIRVNYIC